MFFQPLNTKVTLPEPKSSPKTELHELLIEVTVYKENGDVKSNRVFKAEDIIEDQ